MKKHHNICFVAGARPNFMKVAPIINSLKTKMFNDTRFDNFKISLVHTGQHYDRNMSEVFLEDLDVPTPDWFLGVGSGSHAVQTGKTMIAFEKALEIEKPDIVVVVGDVNSTIACALTAKKHNIKVAHVEAGLRSFDMSMPEEINRKLTDCISDLLFVTENSGLKNLIDEGVQKDKIYFVGNVMIDTLLKGLEKIASTEYIPDDNIKKLYPLNSDYALLTLHRPSNIDNLQTLEGIWKAVSTISKSIPIIFPTHPRTRIVLDNLGFNADGIIFLDPLGYLDMLYVLKGARIVFTDSGGIQEETTALKIPCLTIRNNTERPSTINIGTNYLVGTQASSIINKAKSILNGEYKTGKIPPLWDGHAADRIADVLLDQITFNKG